MARRIMTHLSSSIDRPYDCWTKRLTAFCISFTRLLTQWQINYGQIPVWFKKYFKLSQQMPVKTSRVSTQLLMIDGIRPKWQVTNDAMPWQLNYVIDQWYYIPLIGRKRVIVSIKPFKIYYGQYRFKTRNKLLTFPVLTGLKITRIYIRRGE